MRQRCEWCGTDRQMISYHDLEWGMPVHDDNLLFEFLILEGAQAGLSWSTILKKRENYRKAFDRFQPQKIASYTDKKCKDLLENPGIVRNRLKVNATVSNAKAFLSIQEKEGSFDQYIWQFVKGAPIQNSWKKMSDIPAMTCESDAMSREMKNRGFKFVGSTICYAFMQAVGMVNDHTVNCFRYKELSKAVKRASSIPLM